MNSQLIITTTDRIENQKIEKYIGIVSERIVVGAGMFSEFFASFTDVFGGRSQKFEDRLHELHKYLMVSLTKKARELRADAIVGLHIDIDEISGKATQMFMISGVGTAVRLSGDASFDSASRVDGYALESEVCKIKYLDQLDALNRITDQSAPIQEQYAEEYYSLLSGLTRYAIQIPLDFLFNVFFNFYMHYNEPIELSPMIEYLQNCDAAEIYHAFLISLKNLSEESLNKLSIKVYANPSFSRLFNELPVPPYEVIIPMVEDIPPHLWERTVFPLLFSYKSEYNMNDIEPINEIILSLQKEQFPVVWRTEQSGYTKKTVCVCGTAITTAQTSTCTNCQSDKFGFSKRAYGMRSDVIEHLKCVIQTITALSEK
ncbi:MAG: YbjQ family protein [Bacillota bacterium]